jgi:YD repeat-containing protein
MDYQENVRRWPSFLAATQVSSGLSFLGKEYTYGATGNVTRIQDDIQPSQTMTIGYDALSQVTSVAGPWGSANASYDTIGNLLSYIVGTTSKSYTYTANRLTSTTGSSYSYDGAGNVTADGSHTYQYDDASNLVCVDCAGAHPITYAYDGNNRRVSRTLDGLTTYYVHASNGDLVTEYTPSTHAGVQHVYVHGKRIASKRFTY